MAERPSRGRGRHRCREYHPGPGRRSRAGLPTGRPGHPGHRVRGSRHVPGRPQRRCRHPRRHQDAQHRPVPVGQARPDRWLRCQHRDRWPGRPAHHVPRPDQAGQGRPVHDRRGWRSDRVDPPTLGRGGHRSRVRVGRHRHGRHARGPHVRPGLHPGRPAVGHHHRQRRLRHACRRPDHGPIRAG